LGDEVRGVLGDDSSALRAGGRRDQRVVGGLEADLSDVHRVVVVGVSDFRSEQAVSSNAKISSSFLRKTGVVWADAKTTITR